MVPHNSCASGKNNEQEGNHEDQVQIHYAVYLRGAEPKLLGGAPRASGLVMNPRNGRGWLG